MTWGYIIYTLVVLIAAGWASELDIERRWRKFMEGPSKDLGIYKKRNQARGERIVELEDKIARLEQEKKNDNSRYS